MRGALAAAMLLGSGAAAAQVASVGLSEQPEAGVLSGRVCEDLDGDGGCSSEEPGIPNARVLLSDGTFATTDRLGRYHLQALPLRRVTTSATASGSLIESGGRVLVKLDVEALGRKASVKPGISRVVESGPAALNSVDFAVSFARVARGESGAGRATGRGEVAEGTYRYWLSGQTERDHLIEVEGRPAPVTPEGRFRAPVAVRVGENLISFSDLGPEGDLTFFRRRLAVVARERGGVLFIPGPIETLGSVELPALRGSPAAALSVSVTAPAGTIVRVGEQRATLGPSGSAQLPLTLASGFNAVEVELRPPQGPKVLRTLTIEASGTFMASALLGLELSYDPARRDLALTGRGAAALSRSFGALELRGGIDLDATDARTQPLSLLQPRTLAIERALDPEIHPPQTGDDGLAGSWNPSNSRLYLRLTHPRYGGAELGAFQAELGGTQVGRYERSLFGAQGEGRLPLGPVTARLKAFASPPATDLSLPVPAHDELSATGGSLYYLRNPAVVPGSEKLRVETRETLSDLPLEERELRRGLDYDVDYLSGRILLARALPLALGEGPLLAAALQQRRAVLVADYETTAASDSSRVAVFGGRLAVGAEPAGIAASAVQERRLDATGYDYRLVTVAARARLGPVGLLAEAAQSQGQLFNPTNSGGFALSDTGGLTFVSSQVASTIADGWAPAVALRASVSEPDYGGQVWWRYRERGFSDSSYASSNFARQLGASARARLGPVELTGFADSRVSADPRDPLGSVFLAKDQLPTGEDAVLRARVSIGDLKLSAEGHFAQLSMLNHLQDDPERATVSGGRLSAGARADYALTKELSINASHQQSILRYGGGLASVNDTFSAAGVTYRPKDDLGFSLRGGWGPVSGPQLQLGAERAADSEIAYGTWTVDVDGPQAGRSAAAVAGARRRVDGSAEVFAEELFARDVDALRSARAVGIEVAPAKALQLLGRYERGWVLPFASTPGVPPQDPTGQVVGVPGLLRDAALARASYLISFFRVSAIAEVRHEAGSAVSDQGLDSVERWQTLGALAVEARPHSAVGFSGRLNASTTRNRGAMEARLLEGFLGASLRLDPWVVLASYSVVNQLPLGSGTGARVYYQLVSLRPSVALGDRFRLGAGVQAIVFPDASLANAISGSLRPSLRIVGGLEAFGRRCGSWAGWRRRSRRRGAAWRWTGNRSTACVPSWRTGWSERPGWRWVTLFTVFPALGLSRARSALTGSTCASSLPTDGSADESERLGHRGVDRAERGAGARQVDAFDLLGFQGRAHRQRAPAAAGGVHGRHQ